MASIPDASFDLYSELSSSNDPLNIHQESWVRSELASLDSSVGQLDDEMRKLSITISQLRSKRRELVERKASYNNLLSPLRHLPAEILAEILRSTVYANANTSSSSPAVPGDIDGFAQWSAREDRLPTTSQLALLARVCRRWNQVIYGTPSLWCEVDIKERHKGMDMGELIKNLKSHYSRCGSLPWLLSFSSDRLLHFNPSATPQPVPCVPLVGFLKETPKWRSLAFTHQNLDVLAPLFSTDQSEINYSWPELESLHLKGWYYGPARVAPFTTTTRPVYMGAMPRLTSLTLLTYDQAIASWKFPWQQLTSLRLATADSYLSYMQILKLCPNLRSCDLSIPPSANPSNSSIREMEKILATHIHLPELESLKVNHSTIVWPLFEAITSPALKHLVVSTPPATHGRTNDTPVGQAISKFIRRSKCHLKSLALNNLPLQDEDYLDIVTQGTDIQSLQITDHANAGFNWLNVVNKKNLLANVRDVVLHGHFEWGTYGRKYLDRFLDQRGALGLDEAGLYYADGVTFSEEIFSWGSQ